MMVSLHIFADRFVLPNQGLTAIPYTDSPGHKFWGHYKYIPKGSKYFPFRVDPFSEGRYSTLDRAASLESE